MKNSSFYTLPNNEAGVAWHRKCSYMCVILHYRAVFVQSFQHITEFGLYYIVKCLETRKIMFILFFKYSHKWKKNKTCKSFKKKKRYFIKGNNTKTRKALACVRKSSGFCCLNEYTFENNMLDIYYWRLYLKYNVEVRTLKNTCTYFISVQIICTHIYKHIFDIIYSCLFKFLICVLLKNGGLTVLKF